MPGVTRTINALHFEDLEPHRFEDLIRQLIYDFRKWKSLEAVGRLGSDEGMDIRGIEIISANEEIVFDDEDHDDTSTRDIAIHERLWSVQCKRESNIGPSDVRKIVSDNLSTTDEKIYGYILAASCNFSKQSRDAFREECIRYGVQEYYIWGKAEIEDQLFLPKNDHLLFAYFGISLRIRRISTRSELRTKLSLKRKLVKYLGEINRPDFHKSVLIRDPADTQYPEIPSSVEPNEILRWRYWQFWGHEPPDHLAFIYKKYLAFVNWDNKEFDIVDNYDFGFPLHPELVDFDKDWYKEMTIRNMYEKCWSNHIPEQNRAWVIDVRIISYTRILAFDEIGDCWNEGPHLLVDYSSPGNPFEPNRGNFFITTARSYFNQMGFLKDFKQIPVFSDEHRKIVLQPGKDISYEV